jgi:peptidoglycan/xylan/chitin deacetylase (PgdA/CDA1 family)
MKLKFTKRFAVALAGLLILIVFGTTVVTYLVNAEPKNETCEQVLYKIASEFGYNLNDCEYTVQEFLESKNWSQALQPKLEKILESEAEYDKRLNLHNAKTKEYKDTLQIISNLGLPADQKNQDLNKILSEKDGIQKSVQRMEKYILEAQVQKGDFTKSQQPQLKIFKNKIKEARDSGLSVEEYEKLNNSLTTNPVENDTQALKYKSELDSVAGKIDAINAQFTLLPDYQKRFIVNFPILMYHRIEDFIALPATQKNKIRQDLTTSPQAFGMQLDYLQSKGFQTVTMGEVSQAISYKDAEFFNRKIVMLTFDDGYAEHYKIVFPELKKRKMKGVFGIVTNFKGMTWDELREMSRDPNMEIVSHTVSHCPLASATKFNDPEENPVGGEYKACSGKYGTKAKFMPTEEVKFELQESKNILEKELSKPIKYLIYTYGSFNQQTIDIGREVGYKAGLKVGTGPNINLNDSMALGRVNVSGLDEPLGGWFAGI